MFKKTHYCPTCDISCPYCKGMDFLCTLADPLSECDDYYACMGEEEPEEDDDFDWGAMNYDALDCDEDWYAEDAE